MDIYPESEPLTEILKQNKAGDLNEDQAKDEEDKVQKMTDKYIKQIDEAVDAKSKEIMTV